MTSIKLKKSSVAGKIPTDSDLAHGELAINFQDGKLFYKDASNNIKAFIDSAAVGSLITAGQGLDSDGVKSVHFGDDEKLTFGNDSDLKISHNGQHSLIQDAGTGQLRIAGSIVNIRNAANNTNMIRAVEGGAVTLSHDGSGKLETTSTGVDVTGKLVADSAALTGKLNINMGSSIDPAIELLGDGPNTIRFFDGQNRSVTTNAVDIAYRTAFNDLRIERATGQKIAEFGGDDGHAALYFNDTKRLETRDSGVDITGKLFADSAQLSGKLRLPQITNALEFGASAGGGGTNAIDMNNCNIIGINRLVFNDPGAGEGLQFSNIKLFESPDDLSNAAGSLQVTYSNARIFTVSDSGVNITGNLRINDAPADFGLDSTNVINLIDSDYVLNRSGISIPVLSEDSSLAFNQRLSFQAQTSTDGVLEVQPKMSVLDSAGTETLVNVNFTGGGGIDSAATVAIINDRFTTDVTFGGDVTFDSANAVFFDKSDQSLSFGNNRKAKFGPVGGGGGLSVTHTGSFGFVDTNFMQIRNNGGTKVAAQFFPTSAQRLFHDGSVKFETTDSGVRTFGSILGDSATINGPAAISGDLTLDSAGAVFFDKSDKSLKIGENHIAKFGENGDFEVKHTNGNSILKANNGPIFIQTNATNFGVHIGKTNASETMGKFIPDGAVELYHNNIKKFETTDSGVTVTGSLRTDSATIGGLTFPTADGTVNQAILTDGSGNLTFGTVATGAAGGVTGTFNKINVNSFTGDSSTTAFALSSAPASGSKNSVVVTVNGVVQHVNTYSLSGSTITLDSAPETGDAIEMRVHDDYSANVNLRDYQSYVYTPSTDTSAFSGSDTNGNILAYDQGKVEVYLNGSRLVTGLDYTETSGTTLTLDSAIGSGDTLEIVSLSAASIADFGVLPIDSDLTTTDSAQIIHEFDRATFRTVKYIVQLEHDSDNKYHSEEILLSHNNTVVGMTTYAQVLLDSNLGTFDADISGANVRLKLTPTKTNTSVKLRAIRVGA